MGEKEIYKFSLCPANRRRNQVGLGRENSIQFRFLLNLRPQFPVLIKQ